VDEPISELDSGPREVPRLAWAESLWPWIVASRTRIHELQISYEQLQQQLFASRECGHCGAFDHRMYFDYLEAQRRILEAVKAELFAGNPPVVVENRFN
jgi:hypothetical protein